MLRRTCFLWIVASSVVACDGTASSSRDAAEAPTVDAHPVVEPSMAALVGLWDDRLDGENTKLDLRADGTAHIVSMAVVPATWTFDVASLRVTITSRRQADGSTVERHVTYAPAQDVLTERFSEPSRPEHVFGRASRDAIDGWAGLRPRVEADEAAGRDIDEQSARGTSLGLAELREAAHVGSPLHWRNRFEQYLQVHQIYVCTVSAAPEGEGGRRTPWRLSISKAIRGPRSGTLLCDLPGGAPAKVGSRVIVLGNDHKTGFNTIGWWEHSAVIEAQIQKNMHPQGENDRR